MTLLEADVKRRNIPRELHPAQSSHEPKPAAETRPDLDLRSGLPLVIDTQALVATGLLPNEKQADSVAHEYRSIKYWLRLQQPRSTGGAESKSRLLGVTSALPGDGKTTVSLNLGLSYTDDDEGVILVDADLAKRGLSQALGAIDRPGLANLIATESLRLNELLLRTSIPGLFLLPAGNVSRRGIELIGTTRGSKVVSQVAQLAGERTVIFDTSPLLLTSESSLLAAWMDQIVLVVRAGQTSQDAAVAARARLQRSVPTSVILNDWKPLGLAEREYHDSYNEYHKR